MKRRAFSLAEALISMAVFGIMLAIIATLVNQYSRIALYSTQSDTTQAALFALDRLRGDCQSAFTVSVPTAGQLQLTRLNPQCDPLRLPSPQPPPELGDPVVTWDPKPAAFLMQVDYRLVGTELTRSVTYGTESVDTVLARDITAFEPRLRADGVLNCRLQCTRNGRDEPLEVDVFRPLTLP